MRCDEARAAASMRVDGEPWAAAAGEDLDRHLAGCSRCRTWLANVESIRHALRFEVVSDVPDVAGGVLARLPARVVPARTPRPGVRRFVPAAAALVAGIVIGATVVSGVGPGSAPAVVQADLPEQVAAAQVRLASLAADVVIRETGWHRDVPLRTFTGRIAYRSPESLALELADTTRYPSAVWARNDVTLVVDGDRSWQRGPFACPADAQPSCTPPRPRIRSVTGREPFSEEGLDPLELVLPAAGFQVGTTASVIDGRREVAGREAVGVVTTAAQLDAFLGGLHQAGNWRAIHPADPVELWLDAEALVPLSVEVRAGPGLDRERWAAARSYDDEPGTPILTVRLDNLELNGQVPDDAFPPAPPGGAVVDAGFRAAAPGADGGPQPAWLPPGMAAARAGVLAGSGPRVAVATWTDGRAWLKVRSVRGWSGGRLFGDLGPTPRQVDLGAAGVGYVGTDGDRVALHGPDRDVVVSGSLAAATLERVAASLGVHGEPVPPSWAEAGSATLAEAAARGPLLVPGALDGFAPPAVRIAADTVTLAYAGPGARGFVIVQRPGTMLVPPADADARGVRLRGTVGRYSPALGLLEWVDGGTVVSIESRTLALAELVAIAAGLGPQR